MQEAEETAYAQREREKEGVGFRNESDRRESDSEGTGDGSSKVKSVSTEKASTSANERLRRSTRQKNPVVRFGYNEYVAHHYAYMTRVAEVREPESYIIDIYAY